MDALTEMIRDELEVYKLRVGNELGREASFYETCCRWIDDGRFDHYLNIIKQKRKYELKEEPNWHMEDSYSNISANSLSWQEAQELLEYE